MPVNTPRKDYTKALKQWLRGRDCAAGGDAVKERGELYLPKLDSHVKKPLGYENYKKRALFYNATGRTIEGLSGVIFQKPMAVEVPDKEIEEHLKDLTLSQVDINMFGVSVAQDILTVGRGGILLDMATSPDPANRPYWQIYRAEQIINWRCEKQQGDETLTMVVLKEDIEEVDPKDKFVTKVMEQYRVLEIEEGLYVQRLFRKKLDAGGNAAGDFIQYGPEVFPIRRGQRLGFIPFQFINSMSVSPEIEKMPLLDMIDVNLSHYRTSADLEHGRHFCALPTPWVSGIVDSNSGPLGIGSGEAWVLDVNGKAGMLEFTGQGLGALEKADEEKRKMMATLGARLLEQQSTAPETATAVNMRHAGEHATVKTIANAISVAFTNVLKWHIWWFGKQAAPSDVKASIELNKDYFAAKLDSATLQALIAALQAETISYKTFYSALVKSEIARPGIDSDAERKEIEEQGQIGPELEDEPSDTKKPSGPGRKEGSSKSS